MWITNKLGYDITLSGVTLYKNSQQEISDADATTLNKDAVFTAMITAGTGLVKTDSQPDVNPQYFVRALNAPVTLDGMPTNPNGYPMVSPAQAFDIGKEEGGDADLEANKAVTIDVSAYTEPVEVEPTSGKDGMEKVTVTLNNIPDATAYAWKDSTNYYHYLNIAESPADQTAYEAVKAIKTGATSDLSVDDFAVEGDVFAKTSGTVFTVTKDETTVTFTRDATKDLAIWS